MTNENMNKYEELAATGLFSEEELAKLKVGFENPTRKIDRKKIERCFDCSGTLEDLMMDVKDRTGNFCLNFDIKDDEEQDGTTHRILALEISAMTTLNSRENALLAKAIKMADTTTFSTPTDGIVRIIFSFMNIAVPTK